MASRSGSDGADRRGGSSLDGVTRRDFLTVSGVLVVGLAAAPGRARRAAAQAGTPGAAGGSPAVWPTDRYLGKPVAPDQVDSFLAIHSDGAVTVFTGKVDIGTGGRAALRQMVAEELDVPVERITEMVEGDTALTPDQGPTAGSQGVSRGGQELRRAAATARQALLALAAQRVGVPVGDLVTADGVVQPKAGGPGVAYGELIGDGRIGLAIDAKAALKAPADFRYIGQSVPRPDIPAKVTGRNQYVQDLRLPGMLHGRVIRPPAMAAMLTAVDEASIASVPGARVIRQGSFLGVVAEQEWDAVRAARLLKAEWTGGSGLPDQARLYEAVRSTPVTQDQVVARKGDLSTLATGTPGVSTLAATYQWPIQTHGSIGPSCGVADVRGDRATIWTPSQATHRHQGPLARILGLAKERVRVIYVDGAGSYGQNGYEDAACDAALLSKAVGRPVRVQWSREDEHGWDPKGPPQLLDLRAAVDAGGEVLAWETQAWVPQATQGLPNIPFLAALEAGIAQPAGRSVGQVQQNIDPPYRVANVHAVVHWLADTPLRPSNIRAPGKVANTFAVESFTDEICAVARLDPVEFRIRHLDDPRGVEVLRRAAARMGWSPRPSPRPADPGATVLTGRGIAYVHYKQNENYVAMGMEVAVDPATGRVRVTRVVCAHDCGLMINPDNVASQLEGNILQTISRTLHEEVTFDRRHVTSLDWVSYPILRFDEVPTLEFELIQRLDEPPLGVGEAASAPVPAALANAVFDATGVRLRTVPFRTDRVRAALEAARA
jgi:nicotinate dehydrogenase subunit B